MQRRALSILHTAVLVVQGRIHLHVLYVLYVLYARYARFVVGKSHVNPVTILLQSVFHTT